MIDFSNINTISPNDSKRLKESFFRPPRKKDSKRRGKKKITIIGAVSISAIIIFSILFISNFNIVIIPEYKSIHREKVINLMDNKYASSIKLITPHLGSKITKNALLIDVPFNTKSGFSITLKSKADFYNSRIILVVRKLKNNLKLFTILRDTSFFSNAGNPIEADISPSDNESPYIEIPIEIGDNIKDVSVKRINQLRFMFYQKNVNSLPLLIKEVYLKRR